MSAPVSAHVALVGGLIALLTFFMPWVSCRSLSMSGMDIATASKDSGGNPLLLGLPVAALVVLALAYGRYTAHSRADAKPLALWQAIAGAVGALGGIAVIISIFNARNDPRLMGFGQFIRVEPGAWGHVLGFVAATVGGWLGHGDES